LRIAVLATIICGSIALAGCPLGFTPDQACEASNPTCGLFTDADGDGLCDNPGPQQADTPPDTASTAPDILDIIDPGEGILPDTVETVDPADIRPDTAVVAPVDSPPDTSATVSSPVDSLPPDTATVAVDTLARECPLGLTPAEACSTGAARCAFFTDADADGRCDNPGPQPADSIAAVQADSIVTPSRPANGCILRLPPAAACPYSRQLCPHWMGWSQAANCLNPAQGMLRIRLVLAITAVLLAAGTILSRTIRGRKNRKKARIARTISLVTSLILLGFALQGCYCPLGAFQYVLAAGILAVIAGWVGFAILLLPVVHALFFGRVYCGWVCPMGALQEMLGRIPVKGRLPVPARLDRFLVRFKYALAVLFTAAVVLAAKGVLDTRWPSLFCLVDPFHTVFTLFTTGLMMTAVILIVLAVFSGRFFCRYFCFYGALLGLTCRAGLWTRLCRLGGRRTKSCDESDESSQSCELKR
jgi:hypothetical protein